MQSAKRTDRRKRGVGAIPVRRSSGNVFEDLGLPRSAEAQAKADLAAGIGEIVAELGLTQTAAAKLLNIDQPSVSNLLHGRLSGFSSDRLFRFLNALGRDVEISIRPKRRSAAKPAIRVVRCKLAG